MEAFILESLVRSDDVGSLRDAVLVLEVMWYELFGATSHHNVFRSEIYLLCLTRQFVRLDLCHPDGRPIFTTY